MYFFILCVVTCIIKEVHPWDLTDYGVHDRGSETAKLIDLVHKSDKFEVKYPFQANDDGDETKDAYEFDTIKTLKLHHKKYDVGRKFNDFDDSRALHISNPEVLNAFKEDQIPESRMDLYDDLSDGSYNLRTYQKDLVRADKITMHQLPGSRRKFIRNRAEMDLEMDYSDSSDSDTSEEDDATADEEEDYKWSNSEEDRQMRMDTVEDGQGKDETVKEKISKYVSPKYPLLQTESTSEKSQIKQIDIKVSEVNSNFEKLKNQLSKLIVSSNEKDTLYSDEQENNTMKDKLHDGNENNIKSKASTKKKMIMKNNDHKIIAKPSLIDFLSNNKKNEMIDEITGERSKLVNDSNTKGIRDKKNNSGKNEGDQFSDEKHISWHSRAEKDDNDDIAKNTDNLNNHKEKWNGKDNDSNKKSNYHKTIYDWYEKQETSNNQNNPKKSNDRWGKTDDDNNKDKTNTLNNKESSGNKGTNSWNIQNERFNLKEGNWNKKTNNWKNEDNINKQDVSLYKKHDSENKKEDAWNKKNSRDDTWNKKDNNKKDVSRNKDNDSWSKKLDNWNKNDDRDKSWNKKTDSWKKENERDDNWNKKTDSWNNEDDRHDNQNFKINSWKKENDRDDNWNKKTDSWKKKDDRNDNRNIKTDSWKKEDDRDDNWTKKTDNWKKKDDRDDNWNIKTDSWKKEDDLDDNWNKKTDSWKEEDRDDNWNKKTDSWNKKNDENDSWNKKDDGNDSWNKKTDSWKKKEDNWDMKENVWSKRDKTTYKKRENDDRNVNEDHFKAERYKKKTDWNENDSTEDLKTDSFQNKKSSFDNLEGKEKAEWGNYALFKHLKDKKVSNENDELRNRKNVKVDIKPLRYSSSENFTPRKDQSYEKPKITERLSARTSIPYVGRKPVFD